jgi:hypothetical protein
MGANYTRKSRVCCVTGNATKAEANAGKKILPPEVGRSYIIMGGWIRALGAKQNEAASVDICSVAATPIVNVAVLKAALGAANALASFDHVSNVTRTTYGNDNVVGGIQILTVGTDEVSATSYDYCVEYLMTGA